MKFRLYILSFFVILFLWPLQTAASFTVYGGGSAVDIQIVDAEDKITATEVETALQENRTAIDLNTAKTTFEGWAAANDLDENGALITGSVSDNEIDYTNVNMDDMTDGSTNAAPTLTQESNWDTAYGWGDHSGAGYESETHASEHDTGGGDALSDVAWGILSSVPASVSTLITYGFGTGANQAVQLDGSAKLPPVDGSQLTSIDVNVGASSELTISSNAITPTGQHHSVDGESDADDYLDTITATNLDAGDQLFLTYEHTDRDIFITAQGNIATPQSMDYQIPDGGALLVCKDGTNFELVECGGFRACEAVTISLTSANTAAEINALIDRQPKYGEAVTFQFGDGTYNSSMTSNLQFSDFDRRVNFYGNTGDSAPNPGTTDPSVLLDFAGCDGINIFRCKQVDIYNVEIEFDSASSKSAIQVASSGYVYVYRCVADGDGTGDGSGFRFDNSCGEVRDSWVSNIKFGITSALGAEVVSIDNDEFGTDPEYGLKTSYGIIFTGSTQPDGSTANESPAPAGTIF